MHAQVTGLVSSFSDQLVDLAAQLIEKAANSRLNTSTQGKSFSITRQLMPDPSSGRVQSEDAALAQAGAGDLNPRVELQAQVMHANDLMEKLRHMQKYQMYDVAKSPDVYLRPEQIRDALRRRMMTQSGFHLFDILK